MCIRDSGSAVIELGCGTGYYAIQFAGTCQEYLGVDITPENIALFEKNAKKHRLKNARGQVGDATCPVSYTHLDVYKRQANSSAAALNFILFILSPFPGWPPRPPARL